MAPLRVKSVDLHGLQNSKEHKTDKYEVVHVDGAAVLRRGQPFKITINFADRGYNEAFDKVRVIFNYGRLGDNRKARRGGAWVTNAKELSESLDIWTIRRTGIDERSVTLEMRSPIKVAVGVYHLSVKTSLRSSSDIITYEDPQDVYLLLNPWHKDDLVYMPKERLLDEYILTDIGKVWVGPLGKSRGRHWIYGQFAAPVLKAVILLLDKTGLNYENKGNPILLARAISKLVNSNDEDGGVLTGSWDGIYEGGTPPSMWTGSIPILEQFLVTMGQEVKYGQCWVFAGVITTVCRAIGMPSRVVSNIVSAHDTNASLTIDSYFSLDDEEMPDPYSENGKDSIWNFHVWNDVWMARPDLPPGYGGWQAIDATPQETSDGLYQCGPASLEAIRKGEIGFQYDVSFLLSSVNADLIRWKEDPEALLGYKKMDTNKYHVGRVILTKRPSVYDPNGDEDREDITRQYKDAEGTKEERLAFFKAVQSNEIASVFYEMPDNEANDVIFEIRDIDEIKIGEPFSIIVDIKNTSEKVYTIEATLSAGTVYYTGVKAHHIKKATGVFKLQPQSKEQLKLPITANQYLDKLVEFSMVKIHAIATVAETKQTWAGEDDFQIMKPPLQITTKEVVDLGLSTKIGFKFRNPLKIKLTECKLVFEAAGLFKNTKTPQRDVLPEEEMTFEYRFTPITAGDFKIVAIFYSKELQDITGSASIIVV